MDIPKADPIKIALVLLILSLFLPWFTVSINEQYEGYDSYANEEFSYKIGPHEISVTINEESKRGDNDAKARITSSTLSIGQVDGDFEANSNSLTTAVLLKEKIIASIIIIAVCILNNTYSGDEETSKTLLIVSTLIMLITVFGFVTDIRDVYVSDNDATLVSMELYGPDDGSTNTYYTENIEMKWLVGFPSLNCSDRDKDLSECSGGFEYIDGGGENMEKGEIKARWHPSIGFFLACFSIIFLIAASLERFMSK